MISLAAAAEVGPGAHSLRSCCATRNAAADAVSTASTPTITRFRDKKEAEQVAKGSRTAPALPKRSGPGRQKRRIDQADAGRLSPRLPSGEPPEDEAEFL